MVEMNDFKIIISRCVNASLHSGTIIYIEAYRFLLNAPVESLPDILDGHYVQVFRPAYREFGNLLQYSDLKEVCASVAHDIIKCRVDESKNYKKRKKSLT